MLRFANSQLLNILWILPFLLFVFLWMYYRKRKAIKHYGDERLMKQLMPEFSPQRPVIKFIFILFAISAIIFMLARPQFGSKLKEVKREGVELIVALDVSNSMLAEDIKPNRLQRAKMAITKLVEKLKDDRFGLIVFAGDAYVQIPLTTDFSAAKLFLSSINTNIVPKQGTAIGTAIELALNSFDPSSELEKAIIILTDGENHEDNAIEAANEANEKGVKVYTIGLGSRQGAPIPVIGRYGQKNFRKDESGKTIVSKLDERTLNEVAVAGGGKYFRASNSNVGLRKMFNEISKMEKKEIETKVYADYDDQFQYFAGIALFFLLLDYIVLERKNRWLSNINIFRN